MEESVFERIAEAELVHIERCLEALDDELDVERLPGGVIEVEFADGSKMVINRHGVAQEIWIAARSGGFHFALTDQGRWIAGRDGAELYARLSELLGGRLGRPVSLPPREAD